MAVLPEARICNLALVAIGHSQLIDALDDDSPEAEVANAVYAQSRDAILERVPWKFATLRATLADLGATAVRDGWAYAYSLPSDCIAPRALTVAGTPAPGPEDRIPFELEADASSASRGAVDGMVLLTDLDEAELVYTARVETPALFSPLFIDCLKWSLAAQFALGIAKKPAVARTMEQRFEQALSIAAASQYRQSREPRPPDSEFITTRGG